MSTCRPCLAALLAAVVVAGSPCAAEYHVAARHRRASDANPGSEDAPFRTISKAGSLARPGDTVLVRAGTYREEIRPANPGTRDGRILYAAAPGEEVVVTGADIVTGWERPGEKSGKTSLGPGVWVKRGWTRAFCGWNANMSHGAPPPVGRCEQVIVDGVMYRQVLREGELRPGTFLADPREDKALYLVLFGRPRPPGDEPPPADWWDEPADLYSDDANAHRIEVSVRAKLFDIPAYTTVRGLTFRYAANMCQRSVLSASKPGAVAEDCVVEWTNGTGADVGVRGEKLDGDERCVLRRVMCRFNGQKGFGGTGNGLMEDCVTWGNNVKGISAGWEAGGLKVCFADGFTIRGMRSIDNAGPGIWFDINNTNCTVERCFSSGDYNGIMIEISGPRNVVRNNIVMNARDRGEMYGIGILVQLSDGTLVANNTLVGNEKCGVMLRYHLYAKDRTLRDNLVVNNLFCGNREAIIITPDPKARPGKVSGNASDYNLFFARWAKDPGWMGGVSQLSHLGPQGRLLDVGLPSWSRWGKNFLHGEYSLEEWQHTTGHDEHSIQWDPMLVAPERGDVRPMAGSVALGAGIELMEVTDDYFGRPRPAGVRPTIGAVQEPADSRMGMQILPGP